MLDQLALPFGHRPHFTAGDFLQAPSNAEARTWLGRTGDWPLGRLALCGASGVGKTHLLHVWADRAGARIVHGGWLDHAKSACETPPGALAVDEADCADAECLLHLLNAAGENGHPVLLAAREPPARWTVVLADLSSRLKAMTAVAIAPPEDSLLQSLMMRLLAERQLAIPEEVQRWLRTRLPRTADAMREAVARFDAASLAAGRAGPRAVASLVLRQMQHFRPEPDVLESEHEDFASAPVLASPEGEPIL